MLTKTQFRSGAVCIEDYKAFPCLFAVPGSGLPLEWNGWAFPYFSLATAHEIVKYFDANLRWKGNKIECRADEFDDEPELSAPVMIDGETYYCIGSGCWIWSETSTVFLDLPAEPSEDEINAYLQQLAQSEFAYCIDDNPQEVIDGDGHKVFTDDEALVLIRNIGKIRQHMQWEKAWNIFAFNVNTKAA